VVDYTNGKKFRDLLYSWQKETGFHSNPAKKKENDNYRAIVAMGDIAMPFLIKELATRPCIGMFEMVREILGDFPVIPEQERGRVKRIAAIVIKWYEERSCT
jgi:hypothetical protein